MGVIRVTDVRVSPTAANKIRVTFSEAYNSTALTPGNYVFTGSPSISPAYVAAVSSSVVDLHFGADFVVDANTHAMWRLQETTDTTAGAWASFATGTLTRASGTVSGSTVSAHGFVTGTRIYSAGATGGPGFGAGYYTLTNAGTTTFSYAEAGANGASTGTGSITQVTSPDSGPNGYTLGAYKDNTFDLNGPFKAARQLTANSPYRSNFTLTPRTAVLGEWTMEALLNHTFVQGGNDQTVLGYFGESNNVAADNYLMLVYMFNDRRPVVFWENGVGVDNSVYPPSGDSRYQVPVGRGFVLTVRKQLYAGTQYTYDFYFDGEPVFTGSATAPQTGNGNNADGGTSGTMRWSVGGYKTLGGSYLGDIGSIHFSSVARSNAYIKSSAQAILARPLTFGATYSMQVSNVQDSATSTPILAANGSFEFSVNGTSDIAYSPNPLDGKRALGSKQVRGDDIAYSPNPLDGKRALGSKQVRGDIDAETDSRNFTPSTASTHPSRPTVL